MKLDRSLWNFAKSRNLTFFIDLWRQGTGVKFDTSKNRQFKRQKGRVPLRANSHYVFLL